MNRPESMGTQDTHKKNTNDSQKKYRLWTVNIVILLEGLNQFHGANLALNSDENQDTFGKVTKHKKTQHTRQQEVSPFPAGDHKAARNRHDSTTYTNIHLGV